MNIFPQYPINGTIFREKNYQLMCSLIFSTTFVWNISYSKKDSATYYDIWYDIFINCNWVVTRWQYTFTHKQYIGQHK